MLRPKPLKEVLQQAVSGPVTKCLLLKQDGALLSFAGDSHKEAQVTSAIASNLWNAYHANTGAIETGALGEILMDCEEGRMLITKVATVLLCLSADASAGFGMMRAKARALVAYLEEPLMKVSMNTTN
eukprot:m.339177 g.339177  ORF g.339177 m.339177 type:complete len:128 (+) comp18694_c0_seq1:188-571(+)